MIKKTVLLGLAPLLCLGSLRAWKSFVVAASGKAKFLARALFLVCLLGQVQQAECMNLLKGFLGLWQFFSKTPNAQHVDVCPLAITADDDDLITAVEKNDYAGVCKLLECGADPNACDGDWTVLHRACWNCNLPIISALLKYGANIEAKSRKSGKTPFFMACIDSIWVAKNIHPHLEVAELLVSCGANINPVWGVRRETPLHVACYECRENELRFCEVAKFLVQHGANLDIPNRDGKTPRQTVAGSSCLQGLSLKK
jgi:ankyrin repeat protein